MISTHGVWRHTGVRFLFSGAKGCPAAAARWTRQASELAMAAGVSRAGARTRWKKQAQVTENGRTHHFGGFGWGLLLLNHSGLNIHYPLLPQSSMSSNLRPCQRPKHSYRQPQCDGSKLTRHGCWADLGARRPVLFGGGCGDAAARELGMATAASRAGART